MRRWLALLLCLAPSAAAARTLTADQAVDLALEHSRGIDAAEFGRAKAQAEATQALYALFPKLSASAGYTRLDQVPYVTFDTSAFYGDSGDGTSTCEDIDESTLPDGFTLEMAQAFCEMITTWMTPDTSAEPTQIAMGLQDNYFAKLTLEQILFAGGALYQSRRASQDMLEASTEQLRLARQEAAYSAKQAFYGLMMARAAVELTRDAKATVDAYVVDLKNMVDVGLASTADLLAAQARQSQAQLDAMKAAQGARLAELMFRVTLGLPASETVELLLDGGDPEVVTAEREVLLTQALRDRPDVGALDASLSAMEHYSAATWAGWVPSVVVLGNMNWKNPNYALQPEWYRSADITFAAQWTLWDRGVSLQQHRAMEASIGQLTSQRAMLTEMMQVEIEGAAQGVVEATEQVVVARVGLEQAREALRLERGRFEQGMINNTALLSAQTAAAGAELSLLSAQTNLYISRAALDKALGIDPGGRQ